MDSDRERADQGRKRRAARGVVLLLLRTGVVQVITLGGTIVLLRILTPEDLGTFAVLSFALAFFQFFGDAGLAGALVQSREEPSEQARRTVFTVHVVLAVALVVLVWVLSPAVALVWPKLPPGSALLLRAMSLSFLLTMVRVVPSIQLERRLRFGAIAVAEVVQVGAFYGVACLCALSGLGDWTWPAAVLAQAAAGSLVVFAASPWWPRFGLEREPLRAMLRFGLPFQAKNFIGFANGAVTPLFAGAVLGPAAVGLIGWGQQLAYLPLRLVEAIARVSFPLYARMQFEPAALARVVERSLQFAAFGVFFSTAILLTGGAQITTIVFSAQWLPGLLALYAFSAVLVVGFVSPVIGAAFDALGRPGIVARLSAAWTLLNWIVVPLTTWRWGMSGFILGYCVHIVVGNLAVLWMVRREIPEMRILEPLRAPALAGLGTAAFGWFVLRPFATTPLRLAVSLAAAGLVHAAIFAASDRQAIAIARDLLRRESGTDPASGAG